MSLAVRKQLADAASTAPGVTAQPYYVQVTDAGAAFVRLDRIEYPDRFGGICYWNVVVMLPQDQAAAEEYIDQVIPIVKTALEPHMTVTQVQPQRLKLEGVGVLPCVFINGHREQE